MKRGMKSENKNSGGVHIHLTNRWLYSLIAFGIVLVITVGVYGLTAGVAPANGHTLSSVSAPSGCASNTYIKWTGSGWTCSTPTVTETDPYFHSWYNSGNAALTSLLVGTVNAGGSVIVGGGWITPGSSCSSGYVGYLNQCGTSPSQGFTNLCTCVYGNFCGTGGSTACWEWRSIA